MPRSWQCTAETAEETGNHKDIPAFGWLKLCSSLLISAPTPEWADSSEFQDKKEDSFFPHICANSRELVSSSTVWTDLCREGNIMELWTLMQLLLLGTLLGAAQGQGDELSSEEERKALMLKHLQEVLELSEMTDQEVAQEVVLTEVKEPDGKEKLDEETKKEELEDVQTTQPGLASTAAPSEEEDSFTYVCE
ncbi:C-type lectin domain family 11 member A, partial [Ophiophagus hannah]